MCTLSTHPPTWIQANSQTGARGRPEWKAGRARLKTSNALTLISRLSPEVDDAAGHSKKPAINGEEGYAATWRPILETTSNVICAGINQMLEIKRRFLLGDGGERALTPVSHYASLSIKILFQLSPGFSLLLPLHPFSLSFLSCSFSKF